MSKNTTPLEEEIAKISVSEFDSNYNRTRRMLVRQRFILGLVEMFEQFPSLDFVLFCPGENTASMIKLAPMNSSEGDVAAHMSLTTKVQKALQKTRAAICPQSRDTRSALEYFFNTGPRFGDSFIRLDRHAFTRENLAELCSPEMPTLSQEFTTRATLMGIAGSRSSEPVPSTPSSPKM